MASRNMHYLDKISFLYYASFFWIIPTIYRISRADLEKIKNSNNTIAEEASLNQDKFAKIHHIRGLLGFIVRKYIWHLSVSIIFKFVEVALYVTNTFFTIELTDVLDANNIRTPEKAIEDLGRIGPLMMLMLGTAILRTVILFHNNYFSSRIGIKIRSGISGILFKKMLTASLSTYAENPSGKISSIIQVDVESICDLVNANNLFWEGLFTLVAILVIYGGMLGAPQLIIYSITIFVFLIIFILGMLKTHFFGRYMMFKDQRLELLKSVLVNVRMVKIRCLEIYYNYRLAILRKKELNRLGMVFLAFSTLQTFPLLSNMMIPPLVFLFIDQTEFTGLSKKDMISFMFYFQLFYSACNSLSSCITRFADSFGSCKRVHQFLISEEKISTPSKPISENILISVRNGDFTWSSKTKPEVQEENELMSHRSKSFTYVENSLKRQQSISSISKFALRIQSIVIRKGEFVVVLGKNGSGKSTLVYSILQETKQTLDSEVRVNGSVSFLSQTPWVITDTIKENIVFGEKFDEIKLIKVLKLAQFWDDLKTMEKGIDTFCEENGSNLSGGQRARIALARCFYHESEIMILDDPVNALDAKVARNVLEGSLSQYYSNKTRIITSNIPSNAKYADRVIILERGEIVYNGDYKGATVHRLFDGASLEENSNRGKNICDSYEVKPGDILSHSLDPAQEEIIQKGRVSIKIICLALYEYASFWGPPLILSLVVVAFGMYSSVQNMNMEWIDRFYSGEDTTSYILQILGFGVICIIFLFFAVLVTLLLGLRLSSRMHYSMLFAVLHAKVAEYLDLITSSFLINRFTNDLDFSDRNLPIMMFSLLISILVSGFMVVTYIGAIGNLLFIALLLAFTLIVIVCQNYFLQANNNLTRLINSSKTPLVQLASGIGTGVAEIRAMHKEAHFEKKYLDAINMNIKYYPISAGIDNGLACFINLLNYAMLTIPGFIYIYTQVQASGGSSINLTTISLFLQNVNNIGLNISGLLSTYNQVEALFVNVERCKEFEKIEPENGYIELDDAKRRGKSISLTNIEKNYPKQQTSLFPNGMIELRNVSAIYPGRETPVLSNLNILVLPGESVAVVGRTGSGKSTLAKLLWRGLKPSSGVILFDGQNIATVDLQRHRSEMSVVCQEISLINGTLKENIDPFLSEDVSREIIIGCFSNSKSNLTSQRAWIPTTET